MKIHELVARLRRMNLHEQVMFLRAELRKEKPFSVRRNEIESILRGKLTRQLKRENAA